MVIRTRMIRVTAGLAAAFSLAACGHKQTVSNGDVSTTPDTAAMASTPVAANADTVADHHSKLKGALVGAVVGHYTGHHALAGAAAGALIQHARNKKP